MHKVKRILTIVISLVFIVCLVTVSISGPREPVGADAPAAAVGADKDPRPQDQSQTQAPGVETVDFVNGSFPVDSAELTVALRPGETQLLDRFTALRRADLRGSADLEELLAWAEAHPEIELLYSVTLPNGAVVDSDAEQVALSGITAAQAEDALELLLRLPQLKAIDLTGAELNGAQITALRQAFPSAEITGSLQLVGQELDPNVTSLDLRTLRHEDLDAALGVLPLLSKLETVELGAEGESALSLEEIGQLQKACPNAAVHYRTSLFDKSVDLADEMLDLNHIKMNDQGEAVRALLPYMPKLKVLDMDSCGVDNAHMAAIRDENPNVDVVWRVWFGTEYSVRTNVTMILASKPSKGGILYDDVGAQLMYCTKVRYLDLGHNSDIYDFGFLRYMPDLEIAVISMTGISDLSPFQSCPNIKYIEAGNCRLSDLSPLAECKSLRHLNVGTNAGVHDITPLYDVPLKRLWLGIGDPVPSDQVAEMRRLHPDCEVNTTVPTGLEQGAAKTEGYVMEYWKCYQKYLTADWQFYEANNHIFPAQRPLGWWKVVYKCFRYNEADRAYAFSWNDPKYNPHGDDVKPVNTYVLDTSFLDEDFDREKADETIIPDKLSDPPGELLYESPY